MKKIIMHGFLAVVFAMPIALFAAEFRVGEQSSVQANESIKGDMYVTGGSVRSAGSIAGDLVVAGGNIVVSGDVGADVSAAGGTVTLLSNVADDVRVAGGNITIEGNIGGDVLAGGGQITIGGAGIGGDVIIGGGSIRIDAPITGNVRINGGNIYINSSITGNITLNAEKVTLGSSAVLNGNITYKAQEQFTKEEGAIIHGQVKFEPQLVKPSVPVDSKFTSLWFVMGRFFALLVCALAIGLVFHRYSKDVVSLSTQRPLLELGRGFLTVTALPVISILILATVIGIPLGIIGLASFVVLMLFAWITAPIILGSIVYRYFSKGDVEITWKTILVGVCLFEMMVIVPFIGPLAQMLALFITLGVIVNIQWGLLKQLR